MVQSAWVPEPSESKYLPQVKQQQVNIDQKQDKGTIFGDLLVNVEQELLLPTGGVSDLDDRVVGPIDPSRRVSPFLTIVTTKKDILDTESQAAGRWA